jgi:hypothetical protein
MERCLPAEAENWAKIVGAVTHVNDTVEVGSMSLQEGI